jgi:hypothetical protein
MVLNRRGTYSICQPFWKRFSKKTAGNRGVEQGGIRILLIFDWLPAGSGYQPTAGDYALTVENQPGKGYCRVRFAVERSSRRRRSAGTSQRDLRFYW